MFVRRAGLRSRLLLALVTLATAVAGAVPPVVSAGDPSYSAASAELGVALSDVSGSITPRLTVDLAPADANAYPGETVTWNGALTYDRAVLGARGVVSLANTGGDPVTIESVWLAHYGSTPDVLVTIQPAWSLRPPRGQQAAHVTDTYGRTTAAGWGTADIGYAWAQPGSGGLVQGTVADGEGSLPVGGSINGASLQVPGWLGVGGASAIGRFADCEDPDQTFVLDVGFGSAALRSDGVLTSRGEQMALPDFDPCEPWHLSVEWGGEWPEFTASVKAWQVTEATPESGLVVAIPATYPTKVELATLADSGAGPNAAVLVDLLQVDYTYGG